MFVSTLRNVDTKEPPPNVDGAVTHGRCCTSVLIHLILLTIPIFKTRKQRHRKVLQPEQVVKWWRWNLNLIGLAQDPNSSSLQDSVQRHLRGYWVSNRVWVWRNFLMLFRIFSSLESKITGYLDSPWIWYNWGLRGIITFCFNNLGW